VLLVGGKAGRTQETNFGDYLASLLMKTAQKLPNFAKSKGDVNIGLINAGAIRADIEVGFISAGGGGKGGLGVCGFSRGLRSGRVTGD